MPLSKIEIDSLVHLIGNTKENEINCEHCLSQVAQFAEMQLVSKTIPESLKIVEQHLSICQECREEYETLLKTLREIEGKKGD